MPQCTRPPSSGVLLPLMSVMTSLMFLVPRIAARKVASCRGRREMTMRNSLFLPQAEHHGRLQLAAALLFIRQN
jgi:hypothetical protein